MRTFFFERGKKLVLSIDWCRMDEPSQLDAEKALYVVFWDFQIFLVPVGETL